MNGRIVLVGSGETAPTMIKVHRAILEAAGDGPRALLDTPYGFQANADDLSSKIQQYFSESVGVTTQVARWRRRDEPVADRERSLALLHRAPWVFAGPGSPSYALRQWEGTPVPRAFVDVVGRGGTTVFGSAAAVTVGAFAVPVYEIYKVGDEPQWLPGLDLLGAVTGVTAAVIPHFDNREGGRHDTRYCYLGEQRLELLESMLPADVGVLGVDEHTAVVIDVAAGTVTVHGTGGLTLRLRRRQDVVPSGESVDLADLGRFFRGAAPLHHERPAGPPAPSPETVDDDAAAPSLRAAAEALRARFSTSLTEADADGALAACLELEEAIHAWSADTLQSDDVDMARRALRSMIVELAGAASTGLGDARSVLEPVVSVALDARARARSAGDFATSDSIRDGLAAAGIEVRDTPGGTEWDVVGT